jgi:hypothetical protein
VPAAVRGRYFARRTLWVQLATCASLIAAGLLLQWIEPARPEEAAGTGGLGFTLIFATAALCRLISVVLLGISHEPRFHGLARGQRLKSFLSTKRGRSAWRLVAMGAVLQFGVYLASPYFTPYMLSELGFSYAQYMLATVTIVLWKVALLPAWGRMIDHHGARSTYALAAMLVALSPMIWLWAGGLAWVLIAQSCSGFAWAGYDVAYFALQLESSYARTRAQLFAAQLATTGSAQFLGSLVGAAILAWPHGFLYAFGLSLAARLAAAAAIPALVPRTRHGVHLGRRAMLLSVLGLRPRSQLPSDESSSHPPQ